MSSCDCSGQNCKHQYATQSPLSPTPSFTEEILDEMSMECDSSCGKTDVSPDVSPDVSETKDQTEEQVSDTKSKTEEPEDLSGSSREASVKGGDCGDAPDSDLRLEKFSILSYDKYKNPNEYITDIYISEIEKTFCL